MTIKSNLAQVGPIFAAYGCQLQYNSSTADLEVEAAPKGKTKIVEDAVKDIAKYDNTANYIDGVASLCIADLIDKNKNPLPQKTRFAILTALGIMVGDKFVAQELSLQKNNRSWHFSSKPNQCTGFGDACVNRGINPDPDRKGRTSHRKPEDFHPKNAKGLIVREQLVTPALAKLFNDIPESALTRDRHSPYFELDVKKFSKLTIEERLDIIGRLKNVAA